MINVIINNIILICNVTISVVYKYKYEHIIGFISLTYMYILKNKHFSQFKVIMIIFDIFIICSSMHAYINKLFLVLYNQNPNIIYFVTMHFHDKCALLMISISVQDIKKQLCNIPLQ